MEAVKSLETIDNAVAALESKFRSDSMTGAYGEPANNVKSSTHFEVALEKNPS